MISLGEYSLDLPRVSAPVVRQDASIYLRLPLTQGPCDKLLYKAVTDRSVQWQWLRHHFPTRPPYLALSSARCPPAPKPSPPLPLCGWGQTLSLFGYS